MRETIIFAIVTVIIVIIFSNSLPQLKTESLLVAVVIFGIYLVVSGRVTELGFKDFSVKIKDVTTEPSQLENQEKIFDLEFGMDPSRTTTHMKTSESIESIEERENTENEISRKIENQQAENDAKDKIKILYVV